ncbi:2'-5'-oligoadenylate synthase 1A-like [Ostrea edulis]|uniref:2'-5'-oligoadenylate synthase 1A-like n=1 Tax=Ostrea edulis TaxID=37623 RepID=UPI0020950591|nr:2'-5'-oligoadenylate synthase 1A-like [Ostrea edulis]XP_056016125.1 2'-5'-oligoadenylate synthase 1A-like [Ostrea edulis]
MAREYSFADRILNPEMFPQVCEICQPQRRFRTPGDKAKHDGMKHGSIQQQAVHSSLILPAHSSASNPSSSSPLSTVTTSDLNAFVKNEIEPDAEYNASCKAVVHRLCQFMKNNFPDELRPSEIIKSGSLGKGTAVKGKSDADLVVFMARFHSISVLRDSLNRILDRMKLYLGTHAGCTVEGTTAHAVKVSLSCHAGHTHDVDILPSVNVLGTGSKREIYKTMGAHSPFLREYYSAALAPLQISFVSGVPTKVKTLIRLVKYWRKTCFEESTGRQRLPSSYPLELITIGEWEDAGGPVNFDLRKGFYHVLLSIVNYKRLKHAWNTNYNADKYISDDSCYVMDPANPFNNVMEACNCWDLVESNARQFLRKPLFSGLSTSSGWI